MSAGEEASEARRPFADGDRRRASVLNGAAARRIGLASGIVPVPESRLVRDIELPYREPKVR